MGRQSHSGGVAEYRRRLDALTIDDAIWILYTDHRVHREFEDTSLYLGYMRWEIMVARHLSERCLRQYDYVQSIPRLVPYILFMGADWWFQSNFISSGYAIRDRAIRVQQPSQYEDGYLEWYLTVSHIHIIPFVEDTGDVGPSDVGVPVIDVSLPPITTDADDQQYLQMIAVIMDDLMGLVNPDDEVYTGFARAAHIAR